MSHLGNLAATLRGRRLPFVLSYHGLGELSAEADPHGLLTPPDHFALHLDTLIERGYELVTVEELWHAVRRGGTAADGLGAITFDDGLADTMHLALELCGARGARVTAYLAPGLFGGDHPDLPSGHPILRADEVAPIERAGLSIGAHSQTHVDLLTLDGAGKREELTRSRGELEELLGHPVTTMAYPFGRYDAATIQAAREAGYELACANAGVNRWRPLELPREPVFPSAGTARIRMKAAGLDGPAVQISRLRNRLLRR